MAQKPVYAHSLQKTQIGSDISTRTKPKTNRVICGFRLSIQSSVQRYKNGQ